MLNNNDMPQRHAATARVFSGVEYAATHLSQPTQTAPDELAVTPRG